MDPNVRNFRDFLQLYNKITELCFTRCVDNFFDRDLAVEESACVNRCVRKYANVNQKIMTVYVEVQTAINQRRVAELEAQAQEAAARELEANKTETKTQAQQTQSNAVASST